MSSRSPAARVARRLDARGIHYGWVDRGSLVPDADHRGGVPVDGRRADRAAAGRVRLVERDDLGRGRDQPRALRPRRPVRGRALRSLRHPPRDRDRPGDDRDQLDPDDADRRAVAARPALGRRERPRHGGDRRHAGRRDREPLVRRAARNRDGDADREQRHGPARVPAAARLDRHRAGLALGRADGVDRRARVHAAARRALPAGQPRRDRVARLRRRRGRPGDPAPEPVPGRDRRARDGVPLVDVLAAHAAASSSAARRRTG